MKKKVRAAGAGGALATAIVWIAAQFGVEMPAGVGEAFAALLATAFGYIVRDDT